MPDVYLDCHWIVKLNINIAIEVLVDLREAVLQIGRHFHLSDPRLAHISLIPDYSMDSHAKDHETYAGVMRSKKRRAKALLDFERHDDDELGFRKNDLITVISQKVSLPLEYGVQPTGLILLNLLELSSFKT